MFCSDMVHSNLFSWTMAFDGDHDLALACVRCSMRWRPLLPVFLVSSTPTTGWTCEGGRRVQLGRKFRAKAADPALAERLTARATRAAERSAIKTTREIERAEKEVREAKRAQQAERDAAIEAERAKAESGECAGEPGNLCLRRTAWWGWEDSNFQPNDY
jgi:hypothetical protein